MADRGGPDALGAYRPAARHGRPDRSHLDRRTRREPRQKDRLMAPSSLAEARALLLSPLGPVARAGSNRNAVNVSFEFFPPKTDAAEANLWAAVRRLEPLNPAFVSVTYGAGGSTRERTHATVTRLIRETTLSPAAHLTCVGATRSEIDAIVRSYSDAGVRHIVALRGDPPAGVGTKCEPHPSGYANAAALVAGIAEIAPFEISVAGYPEKHPESPTVAHDLENLKAKVDAGATRIITQFFFDNERFLRFVENARAHGIWC